MTNKQALDLIATNCAMNCKKPFNEKCNENCEIFKAFQLIKKDLKMLEILKNHLEIKGYKDDFLYPVIKLCISSVGTEKDFNKIKEWLENDKIR